MIKTITSNVENKFVSIIADETSDCGHYEQLSVVIRFFDEEKNEAVEQFIGLQRLVSVDAQSIFNCLTNTIAQVGLKWDSVISVCFDGAASMAGSLNGVQAKAKEANSKISYVHCYGHCLNLVLVDSLGKDNKTVFNFFGCLQMIYSFVEGSPTRHSILEQIVQASKLKLKTLKSLSTTRWACRSEAVEAIKTNYSSLLKCLEEIAKKTTMADVRAKAKGLLYQMKTFKFVFVLQVISPILIMILKVSATLQDPNLNLLSAVDVVLSLKAALTTMRSDNINFSIQYNEAVSICNIHEINLPEVKIRKISSKIDTSKNQYFPKTKQEELKNTVYIPLLDNLIMGIEERFNQDILKLINAMGRLLKLDTSISDLHLLSEKCMLNESELDAEIKLIKHLPKEQLVKLQTGSSNKSIRCWLDWLKQTKLIYCNVYKAVKLFITIPVTSCTCERSFSKLSIVKTKLRSLMTQDRLDNLLLIFIEQELANSIDYNKVMDEFKHLVPGKRRLEL